MQDCLFNQLKQTEYRVVRHQQALKKEIKALERRGLTKGRPTLNRNKYLYMYYPNSKAKGGRDRVYIGNNPKRVAQAMEAVERTRQHTELNRLLSATSALLNDTRASLARVQLRMEAKILAIEIESKRASL